jgi:spore coat protein CotH
MVKQVAIFCIGLVMLACKSESDPKSNQLEIPDWTDQTHGKLDDPGYTIVFPQQSVNRIDITIEAEDWQTMQADLTSKYGGAQPMGQFPAEEPVFVPCTFTFNNTDWYKVGIRYKGNSTLKTSISQGIKKLPLKFDFDEFEDTYPEIKNQRFYGFKQLSFSNGFDDKSLMREKVVADIFRHAGVRAPQTAFYRVYLDYGEGSKYFGLYTAVEVVDDTMIEDQFGNDDGNIYKPDGQSASFTVNSFSPSHFEKCNNEETDWSDIQGLFSALHSTTRTSDATAWRTALESKFYVDGFLKWLACNTLIQNWDTYGKMTHNYYLYADPANNGKLTWIPWDNNEALTPGKMGGALTLPLTEVTSGWPLIRYIMDQPEYRTQYDAYLEEIMSGAFKPETVQAEYLRLYNLIKPYAVGSDGEAKPYSFLNSSSEFDAALSTLNTHVSSRFSAADDYLH